MWQEVAKRSAWLTLGSIVGRFFPYGALVALGKTMSAQEFASISISFVWCSVAASLTTSGLAILATQQLAQSSSSKSQIIFIRRTLRTGTTLAIGLIFLILLIGIESISHAFGQVVATEVVLPALISGGAWSISLLVVAVLNGRSQSNYSAYILSVGGTMQGALLFLGYTYTQRVSYAAWGLAAGSLVALLLAMSLLWLVTRKIQRNAHSGEDEIGTSFYGPLCWNTLAAASVMPTTLIASSFLAKGPSAAQYLATFHALEQIHQLAIFAPGILAQALLPSLAVRVKEEPENTTRLFLVLALVLGAACSLLALMMTWNSSWIHNLFGNPALNDSNATRFMALNAGASISLALMGATLLSRGMHIVASSLNLFWAVLFILLSWKWANEGVAGIQLARLSSTWCLAAFSAGILFVASSKNK